MIDGAIKKARGQQEQTEKSAGPTENKSKAIKILDATKLATSELIPNFKPEQLEIILVGKGINVHQISTYRADQKYISETEASKEYEIKQENLLLLKPFFGQRKFIAIFDDQKKPIEIKKQEGKITAFTLYLADRSTTLGQSLKEMFSKHIDSKKIFFFVIIGVVVAVVYFIISGGGF